MIRWRLIIVHIVTYTSTWNTGLCHLQVGTLKRCYINSDWLIDLAIAQLEKQDQQPWGRYWWWYWKFESSSHHWKDWLRWCSGGASSGSSPDFFHHLEVPSQRWIACPVGRPSSCPWGRTSAGGRGTDARARLAAGLRRPPAPACSCHQWRRSTACQLADRRSPCVACPSLTWWASGKKHNSYKSISFELKSVQCYQRVVTTKETKLWRTNIHLPLMFNDKWVTVSVSRQNPPLSLCFLSLPYPVFPLPWSFLPHVRTTMTQTRCNVDSSVYGAVFNDKS